MPFAQIDGAQWFVMTTLSIASAETDRREEKRGGTCGEVFIHWPVVHLQGGVTPVPGESDQMVFAVVYRRGRFLHADVHCPNVECHTRFALFLRETRRKHKQKKLVA